MDPNTTTGADWDLTSTTLKLLWVSLLFALGAGFSLVTAHAIIPSAVATRTIPKTWEKLRWPLYAFGIASVAGIGITLAFGAVEAEPFITRIYDRYWQ